MDRWRPRFPVPSPESIGGGEEDAFAVAPWRLVGGSPRWPLLLLATSFVLSCGDDTTSPNEGEAAEPRINEFLASNQTGLMDEDGNASDWIELYHPGPAAVDLSGWYLTDDETDSRRWALPSVTLEPDEYLVIFASGEDRSDPSGELHTNFRLASSGEHLSLVRPDGTVGSEFAPFPPQSADVSYGVVSLGAVGYLLDMTPGGPNSGEAVGGLTMSPNPGVFTESISVRLAFGAGPQATIHYTTDGSQPTAESPVYEGPVVIDRTTRLRARGLNGPVAGSEVSGFFTAISDSVASFTSDLPIVVLHAFKTVPNDGVGAASSMTVVGSSQGRARPTDVADYSGGARIDMRGSSSLGFPKKQYRIELQDAAGEDATADLLGMGPGEDWILYAPGNQDRNMIANPLMQRLARGIGLTEVSMTFVELYLNDDRTRPVRAGDYVGLYLLGETISIGESRIDIARLEQGDNEEPEVTGGYVFSIDRPDDNELRFKSGPHWVNLVRPKLSRLSPAQRIWAEGYIRDFEVALYGPRFNDPGDGYARYIDLESWIDSHILRLMAKERDFLEFSHYMTKDRGGKLRSEPVWDFDRALNSTDGSNKRPAEVHSRSRPDPFNYGWWGRLFSDPAYMTAYRVRWAQLRGGRLSEAAIFREIDELAAEIEQAYGREDARWGDLPDYGSRHGTLAGEITALKRWLSTRLVHLDGVLAA